MENHRSLQTQQELEFEVGILSSLVVGMDERDDNVLKAISNILGRLENRLDFPPDCQQAVKEALASIEGLLSENLGFTEVYNKLSLAVDLIYQVIGEKDEPFSPSQQEDVSQPFDVDNPELNDFVSETDEYLESAEAALLVLEKHPQSAEHIDEVFRCFHNIKGIAGFLSLTDFMDLSHAAEWLMDSVRSGQIELTGIFAQLIFDAVDMLRAMLTAVREAMAGKQYRTPDFLLGLIERLQDPEIASTSSSPLVKRPKDTPKAQISAPKKVDDVLRVSTTKLDALIDSVGELIIANGMVQQEADLQSANPRFLGNVQRLGKIIRELQEQTMGLRMVTLESTFRKLARISRDLSVSSNVPIEFTFAGENTELDRSVVEDMQSPLVHMVRNAIDHGIERPEEREPLGKPQSGKVHIEAFHKGGNVVIEISDDGRGLDKTAILEKAVAAGIVASGTDLPDKDIYELIFEPGFSTNKVVTEVSGRGVGMDVVKRSLEKLRGRLETRTENGKGTTFSMYLPLTTAVIDGMVVTVGRQHMIVPSIAIQESLRPVKEQLRTVKDKGELILIRGDIIPLFRLNRLFDIPAEQQDPTEALVLVITDGNENWALLVDDLLGQQQVVVKPMDHIFSGVSAVSGASIMGDGSVALILDAAGLLKMAREVGAI